MIIALMVIAASTMQPAKIPSVILDGCRIVSHPILRNGRWWKSEWFKQQSAAEQIRIVQRQSDCFARRQTKRPPSREAERSSGRAGEEWLSASLANQPIRAVAADQHADGAAAGDGHPEDRRQGIGHEIDIPARGGVTGRQRGHRYRWHRSDSANP